MRRTLGWVGCLLVWGSGAAGCGGRSLMDPAGTDDHTADDTTATSAESGTDPAPPAVTGRCATNTNDSTAPANSDFTSSTGPGRTGSGTGPGTDDGATSGTGSTTTDNTNIHPSPTNSVTTSDTTAPNTTDSTAPTGPGAWVLVRSGAPDDPTDIWDYDEQGLLLYQRQSQASRTYGQYIMNHTFTYDDNSIVHAARADVPDSTIDYVETYVFEAGLLRVLTHAGTDYTGANYTTTAHYDYDANQRLVRIQDISSSYTRTQVLERRETGEPFRWFVDDVLHCLYSWRLSWLGTECYDENGEVSKTYVRTGDGQLGAIISSVSTNEFEYDAAGRLTAGFGTSYEYDATGRLLFSRVGSQVTQFFYDDLGLLQREETVQETGVYPTDYTYERSAVDEVTRRAIRGEYVVAHTYRWMDVAPQPIPTELSFTDEMHMSYPRVYEHPVDYSVVE